MEKLIINRIKETFLMEKGFIDIKYFAHKVALDDLKNALDNFVEKGFLVKEGENYKLTLQGEEEILGTRISRVENFFKQYISKNHIIQGSIVNRRNFDRTIMQHRELRGDFFEDITSQFIDDGFFTLENKKLILTPEGEEHFSR